MSEVKPMIADPSQTSWDEVADEQKRCGEPETLTPEMRSRSWVFDTAWYSNTCSVCSKEFVGYKGRVICLLCDGLTPMTFARFSEQNKQRCEHPNGFNHKLNSWSTSDWMTATMGELGEAANIVKKLNRVRDGIPGNGDLTIMALRNALADEIADTFIYLDLLAQSLNMNMANIIMDKFNRTSLKIGYMHKP